jgi:O-antigen ligase
LAANASLRGRTGGWDAVGALALTAPLIVLAWQQGGYHSATWTLASVYLACIGLAALSQRERRQLNLLEWVMLGALVSFAALLVLSMVWSEDPASSLREGRRAILYVFALAAFFVVRTSPRLLSLALCGVLATIVVLSAPVGYANSVGILAVIAMLLAIEIATTERGLIRWLAVAALVVLPSQLLATSSRGAWLALAAGLAFRTALPQRRPFLPSLARRLGRFPAVGRFGLAAALAAIVAIILASPTNPFGEQRRAYWSVAWHDIEAHPVLGSGAGTYARRWHQERPLPVAVQDAHSLYLETLAETGLPGLFLLAVVLGTPLLATLAKQARSAPISLAPAYVAYLVHAGIDWDWEMPIVTLSALACAATLVQSRGHYEVHDPSPTRVPRSAALRSDRPGISQASNASWKGRN